MNTATGRSRVADKMMSAAGCDHPRQPGEPTGYVAWFDWVARYAKTHTQRRCPKCRLWVVWEEK